MDYHPDLRTTSWSLRKTISSIQITPPNRTSIQVDEGRSYFASTKDKLIKIMTSITVEPPVMLFTIAIALGSVTTQSLAIRKYCLIQMGQSDAVCRNLTSNAVLEQEAQQYTMDLIMYKTMIETLPGALWGMVIGSWSDKYGRMLLLILPNVAWSITAILMALNAYFESELNANFILVSAVPVGITGGTTCFMTGITCYVADVTNREQRTVRFAILQASLLSGFPIGLSIGGIILKHYGYLIVYITATCLHFIALLYVIFLINETVKSELGFKDKFIALFNFENVKDGVETVLRKRPRNDRFHLILLMTAVTISFLPLYAEYNITYLYTRLKFQWDEIIYSNYTTAVLVASMIGLMIGMPIMSLRLKLKDITIGVISSASKIVTEVIMALGTEGWMLFAALPIFLFNGLTNIIIRTMLSKIVSEAEQGKILSVMSGMESAMPTVGSIIFSRLYNSTLDSFPGAIFLLGASLATIPAAVLIWMYVVQRKNKNITTTSASKTDLVERNEMQTRNRENSVAIINT